MHSCQKYTDSQLLEQMQAGNMLAFDEMYVRYRRRLFNFANYILKNSDEAENIVHEVFIKLWESRDSVKKLKSFLFSVAYNATITRMRKKINERDFIEYLKTLPPAWENPVDVNFEYKELEQKATHIIEKLPERQKNVYKLSREEGLTYTQIAEKLGISPNTVENHMVKALRKIREELEKFSVLGILFFYLVFMK